jgi:dTDP-4-dehydrorhamnose reductase
MNGQNAVVVGATGMLGRAVLRRLRQDPQPIYSRILPFGSRDLDIRDAAAVHAAIRTIRPSLVINCAGYTDVDAAESHAAEAMAVNALGAAHLAQACAQGGAILVHISTDFVFDGQLRRPYRCGDLGRPLSAYGFSKWEGELAVREAGCRHLIVRTSWLFGRGGRNFVDTILDRALSGERLRVVNDQVGRPTFTEDLAGGILRLLLARREGTYHFANNGRCSWFEFAEAVLEEAGIAAVVEPIRSADLRRPAKRPAYSVLDLSSYIEATGDTPPSWRHALSRYMLGRHSPALAAEAQS